MRRDQHLASAGYLLGLAVVALNLGAYLLAAVLFACMPLVALWPFVQSPPERRPLTEWVRSISRLQRLSADLARTALPTTPTARAYSVGAIELARLLAAIGWLPEPEE